MLTRALAVLALVLVALLATGISWNPGVPSAIADPGDEGTTGDGTEASFGTYQISWAQGSNTSTIDGSTITTAPASNTGNYTMLRVDFSLGGEDPASPGEIEIRVPYHIYFDRQGAATGDTEIPLVEAPTESGDTGFNYSIDDKGTTDTADDEIVITNYETVTASYVLSIDIKYDFTASYVRDGYVKDDIQTSFSFSHGDSDPVTAESNTLTAKVDTTIGGSSTEKYVIAKYESWQSNWASSAKPENPEDYFYVVWHTNSTVYNQTATYHTYVYDEPQDGGTIVAYRESSWGGNSYDAGDPSGTLKYTQDSAMGSTALNIGGYNVVVAYPRTLITESDPTPTVHNKYTTTKKSTDLDENGDPMETRSSSETASYTYVPPDTVYPGDKFSVTKSISNYFFTAGVNRLLAGKELSNTYWYCSVTDRGYGSTKNADGDYGVNPYSTVFIDDTVYLSPNGDRLDPGDYEIEGFDMAGLVEYDAVTDEEGYHGKASTDYEHYQPVDVYVKTTGSGDYQHYAKIERTGQNTYRWTVDGQDPVEGPGYTNAHRAFPDNTYAVKFVHEGTSYQVDMKINLIITINPTDHVKSILNSSDDSWAYVYNIDTGYHQSSDGTISAGDSYRGAFHDQVSADDEQTYGTTAVSHDTDDAVLTRTRPYGSCTKQHTNVENDSEGSYTRVTYQLDQYDYLNRGGGNMITHQDVIDSGSVLEHRDGTFYDLLPPGTTVDISTLQTTLYQVKDESGNPVTCEHTVETIENWRDTGRTMLVVHVTAPDGVRNYADVYEHDSGYHWYRYTKSGFSLTFDLIDTWENIHDNGNLDNEAVYHSNDGDLASGRGDDGAYLPSKASLANVDDDSSNDSSRQFMYMRDILQVTSPMAAQASYRISVKSDDDLAYDESTEVAGADYYTYRLRFQNDESYTTKDVVMYDVLEIANPDADARWKGTLAGVNVALLRAKGIDAKVYYSTSTDWSEIPNDSEQGGAYQLPDGYTLAGDPSRWTTEPPDDLSKVTAIAIDCSKKTDGTDYVFDNTDTALAYVEMQAPSDVSTYLDDPDTEEDETVYAYNSSFISTTRSLLTSPDTWVTSVDECPYVQVELREPSVIIDKTSDPATGTETDPTELDEGDSLTYYLNVSNTNDAERVDGVVVEDVIPDGLTIDTDGIDFLFGTVTGGDPSDSDPDRVSVARDGQKLTFTIDKLAAGETVRIVIPTSVDEVKNETRYDNTSKITRYNGRDVTISSETTHHKAEPEPTSVQVTKRWDDDEDAAGSRPDSVTIRLVRSSDGTASTVVATQVLDGEVDDIETEPWAATFTGLDAWDDDGNAYAYTVTEDAVPNYSAQVSGSMEDGWVVTNTYVPPEDNTPPEEVTPPEKPRPVKVTPAKELPDTADTTRRSGLPALGLALLALGALARKSRRAETSR